MSDKLRSLRAGTDLLTIDGFRYSGALFRALVARCQRGDGSRSSTATRQVTITVRSLDGDIKEESRP